ncbi:MAG TPA: hypothetical protein H9825_02885 [Candidatus Sphingobacterium stercorigallinarum]|nr:hypothetical protein [Candidatus Sphingobacterium stercorigallinarum]
MEILRQRQAIPVNMTQLVLIAIRPPPYTLCCSSQSLTPHNTGSGLLRQTGVRREAAPPRQQAINGALEKYNRAN